MTYYELLQISSSADDEMIKAAYKIMIKRYHPDVNPPEEKQYCEQIMQSLNEAREILLDPEERKRYDEWVMLNNNNINTLKNKIINKLILKAKPILGLIIMLVFVIIINLIYGEIQSIYHYKDIKEAKRIEVKLNKLKSTIEGNQKYLINQNKKLDVLDSKVKKDKKNKDYFHYLSDLDEYNQNVSLYNGASKYYQSNVKKYNKLVSKYNKISKKAYSRWAIIPIMRK